ncbi:4083_t:CDS:1, partial [Cetraspora pellucida]
PDNNPNINPLKSDKCNSSIVEDVSNTRNVCNSSTLQPIATSSFKDPMEGNYDSSYTYHNNMYDSRPLINIVPAKSSSVYDVKKSIDDDNNILGPPIINILPTKSSLPVDINQSNHDESLTL